MLTTTACWSDEPAVILKRIGGVDHTGAVFGKEVVIAKLRIIWVIWVITYNGAKIPSSKSKCRHSVNTRAIHPQIQTYAIANI